MRTPAHKQQKNEENGRRLHAANDERSHAGPKTVKCNRDGLPALAGAACYLDQSRQLSEGLRKRGRGCLVQNDLRVAILLG